MFYIVYNWVALLLLLPVTLFHLYQKLRGSRPPALSERFGRIPQAQLDRIGERPVIWVHAVSVGETLAAKPLLGALKERYPDHLLLVSNSTGTGREITGGIADVDLNICFPFDFLPAVRRALQSVQPRLVVIMETEVWPNFTREAARLGIPVLLANGRISDRSFPRYRKFSWVFRPALRLFSALCMQSALDRERIVAIGAKAEAAVAVGNLKCDIPFREVTQPEKGDLRAQYFIPGNLTVITAGSTRPGEEEHLLKAYRELLPGCPDLFLVLVPRHPERAGEVADILDRNEIRYRRRTGMYSGGTPFRPGEVLLIDTVGELMKMYSLADLVFVGGSLVPIGGHNILEPASLAVPSVFGPYMNNFRDISAVVLRYQAGVQVAGPEELVPAFGNLLGDLAKRRVMGLNALKMMQENGGATQRHMEIVEKYLESQARLQTARGAQ